MNRSLIQRIGILIAAAIVTLCLFMVMETSSVHADGMTPKAYKSKISVTTVDYFVYLKMGSRVKKSSRQAENLWLSLSLITGVSISRSKRPAKLLLRSKTILRKKRIKPCSRSLSTATRSKSSISAGRTEQANSKLIITQPSQTTRPAPRYPSRQKPAGRSGRSHIVNLFTMKKQKNSQTTPKRSRTTPPSS